VDPTGQAEDCGPVRALDTPFLENKAHGETGHKCPASPFF
jgi:hypothetical protein